MNKLSWRLFLLIFFVSITFSFGCSNKLSRDKAKDLIIKHFKYPQAEVYQLDWGERVRTDNENFKCFVEKGVIKFVDQIYNRLLGFPEAKVLFTQEGKKYLIGDIKYDHDARYIYRYSTTVKLADKLFVQITGIRFTEEGKTAEVQFVWRYNLTPFGECAYAALERAPNEGPYIEIVHMALYDDGWRIVGVGEIYSNGGQSLVGPGDSLRPMWGQQPWGALQAWLHSRKAGDLPPASAGTVR